MRIETKSFLNKNKKVLTKICATVFLAMHHAKIKHILPLNINTGKKLDEDYWNK